MATINQNAAFVKPSDLHHGILFFIRWRCLLFSLASFLLGSVPAAAATIFVDSQNNSGVQDGTAAHPYRTLSQALAAAAPDDTIAIRTGSYALCRGRLNKPATFRADNGLVTISLSSSNSLRRSIFTLDPNGPEIASLRRGIQVMQSRPPTDPTSWIYQANIHATTDSGALAAWNTCQHASFFFFSWHRMYLYYFERILRAASGDPNLALPYWNYTDDPNLADPDRRQLPLAFRQPADLSNPLFVSQRDPKINNGTKFLPPGAVDYSRAFMPRNFEAPAGVGDASFGGSVVSQPAHFNNFSSSGRFEVTPHNVVHSQIGGWMADPVFAARDPIFLLHHANVDRLWKRWLTQGDGRQDPTSDQVWMNTPFPFFDESGQRVQRSGRDILNTVDQLNYCYDDEPGG